MPWSVLIQSFPPVGTELCEFNAVVAELFWENKKISAVAALWDLWDLWREMGVAPEHDYGGTKSRNPLRRELWAVQSKKQ